MPARLIKISKWKRPACWLFLFLIAACEEPPRQQPGELSYQQAQRAMANSHFDDALTLFQRSSEFGYVAAVEPTVQLMLRLQVPSHQRARWWNALPESAEKQSAALQLGFWDQIEHTQRQSFQRSLNPLQSAACVLSVQPVLSDAASLERWRQLQTQWPQQAIARLPICYETPLLVDSRRLACSDSGRLQCDLPQVEPQVVQSNAPIWLILSGHGLANYNNGFLLAPVTADWQLLAHELSHALGFIDEYALHAAIAKDECLPRRITPNLLFDKNDLALWRQRWDVEQTIELTEVESCRAIGKPAWRPVAAITSLQHYEYPFPPLYLTLMEKVLKQPEQILPAQYLLAVLAKQRGDLAAYQQLLTKAAELGYAPAKQALTLRQLPTASGRGVVR